MPIVLDQAGDSKPEYVRNPDDFLRLGHDQGAPRVMSLTKTRQPVGNKAELQQQCRDRGLDDSGTIPVLKERLGPEPAFETYGRPSGFGHIIDDTTNLMKWAERMVALGIAIDPDVLHRLQGIDPADEKKTLDGIVARAREAADADMPSARGTWAHLLTEWAEDHTRTRPIPEDRFGIDTETASRIADGWLKLLDDNSLTVVATEAKVVHDGLRLAGSLDRIVMTGKPLEFGDVQIAAGQHVIVDPKTSRLHGDASGVPSYWSPYGPQLLAYAEAVPYDVHAEQRNAWPFDVNQDHALIAHLDMDHLSDTGEVKWQLIAVDLEVARQGVAAIQAANAYHKATKFLMPDTVTVVASKSAAPSNQGGVEQRAEVTGVAPVASAPTPPNAAQALATEIGKYDHSLKAMVAAEWPVDVPKPGAVRDGSASWNDVQVEQVRQAIATALPEWTTSSEPVTDRFVTEPRTDTPPEPTRTRDEVDALIIAIASSGVRGVVNAWLRQAADNDTSFDPRTHRTVRRYEQTRAAYRLAQASEGSGDDEMTRAILACVTGNEQARMPSFAVGVLIGDLTADEATKCSLIADGIHDGTWSLLIDPDDESMTVSAA